MYRHATSQLVNYPIWITTIPIGSISIIKQTPKIRCTRTQNLFQASTLQNKTFVNKR
jgi:hypothetical protein